MRVKPASNSYAASGFTLLELLIAMSLLALVFAALTGGLRFGTQAWRLSADRLSESDNLQLVYRTMRRQISTSVAVTPALGTAQRQTAFEGHRDRLSFVGMAPALAMNPGLFLLSYSLVPDDVGQALTFRWDRLESAATRSDGDNVEPLLRRVRSVRFSYFGQVDDGEPRWVNEWRDQEILPRLVRINVEFADPGRMPWPEIIIPVAAGS